MSTDVQEALADHQVPADLMALWLAVDKDIPRTKKLAAVKLAADFSWWVPRSAWGARAPRDGILGITPTFGLTIHYEDAASVPHAQCASAVRGIQAYHMDYHGWLDIAYSWLGCQHGYVFEGRGPHQRTAANGTNDGNAQALAHCLMIGEGETPSDAALNFAATMARVARDNGAGHNINGHRDWLSTSCPGDPTYARLDTIRSLADQPNPTPTPAPNPPQPPEDEPMRDERIITIPPPDDQGRQLVTTDKDGHPLAHESLTSSVQIKAAKDGTWTPVTMQWYGYLDALTLSLKGVDGVSPAAAGHQARIVIEHR